MLLFIKPYKLRYPEIPIEYNEVSFKCSLVESVYSIKSFTRRPKYLTDIRLIGPYVNKAILEELRQHLINNVQISDVKILFLNN